MSNIETISSILATAEKRKDRKLGKQFIARERSTSWKQYWKK